MSPVFLAASESQGTQLDEENGLYFSPYLLLITGVFNQALCWPFRVFVDPTKRDGCLSGTEWSRMRSMTLGSVGSSGSLALLDFVN